MEKSHHLFAEESRFKSICLFPLLSFSEVSEPGERETACLNFQGFGEIAYQEPQKKKTNPKLSWDEKVPVLD